MTAMSDYLEAKLLDHVFRAVTYTSPTTLYVALYTVQPTDAGGGTEVTGGSYARQAGTFVAATSGIGKTSNAAVITFTNMPACTVVGTAILDAVTAGNFLMQGALTASRTVVAADNLTIAIGDLALFFA